MVAGVCGWLAAGYVWGMAYPRSLSSPQAPGAGRFGLPEVGIPLAVVILLFLIFVVIQVGYLFGGETYVREATGLSYAEYARRGFFELVTASALVVPMLLIARWALHDDDETALQGFRALAVVLLLLVDLVAVSAFWRMRTYVHAYGLTLDRFFAMALMIWIALLLGWFATTVLRDRAERFAIGALVSGFALLVSLNVLNPESVVARTNLARIDRGLELDVTYLSRLSADAVPAILESWDRLDSEQRCLLADRLVSRQARRASSDWRSANLARHRALEATERGEARFDLARLRCAG
jgi:hypothetical protein